MRLRDRRQFCLALLVILLGASGYGGFRVAAHNGWIIVTFGSRSFDIGSAPRPGDPTQELSLFVVGDTGERTENRRRVVEAMSTLATTAVIDEVLMVGDNFYESGVTSVDDPRFQADFEQAFDARDFDCPFIVCLGNHDYGGDVEVQVQYTDVSPRWKMPARYFRVSESVGNESADIFVLDTEPIHERRDSARDQLNWLKRELSASNAKWKIVMGHHPALTGGRHEASDVIAGTLPPIFERYGVDLYLSGHDHDLQLCDSGKGWLQIVSGAGEKIAKHVLGRSDPFRQGGSWFLLGPDTRR